MHLYYKTIIITLSWLLLSMLPARAADANNTHTISGQQWQQLSADKAFRYRDQVEQVKKQDVQRRNAFTRFIVKVFQFFGGKGGQLVLWSLVILIVGFVVYRMIRNSESFVFGRRKKKMTTDGGDLTEDIGATNWDALLQRAIQNNEPRLAVRYSYMWLLQILNEQQLIRYSNDKTNYEYYRELEPTPYKQTFKHLSRQYEYANYGNYDLSAATFNDYIATFNNLRKTLGA